MKKVAGVTLTRLHVPSNRSGDVCGIVLTNTTTILIVTNRVAGTTVQRPSAKQTTTADVHGITKI